MRKASNRPSGITGKRVDSAEPENEVEHFVTCPACGQSIDMRELGEVLHHEDPGHKPLPLDG